MQSRTRKNQRLVQQFYKQAGLDSQFQLPIELPAQKAKKIIVSQKKIKKHIEKAQQITPTNKIKQKQDVQQQNKAIIIENIFQKNSFKIPQKNSQPKQQITSQRNTSQNLQTKQQPTQLIIVPYLLSEKQIKQKTFQCQQLSKMQNQSLPQILSPLPKPAQPPQPKQKYPQPKISLKPVRIQPQYLPSQIQIQKIIRKPNYIKIQEHKRIMGYVGHATTIFKRPILQGNYYVQFKVVSLSQRSTKYSPALRIGICIHNYDSNVPLGLSQSIAYRSIDGNLIVDGVSCPFATPYSQNDVIGVALAMQPPHKYQNNQKISQNSTLRFYKNGVAVGDYSCLKQLFYSFAVSTFNFATVEIRVQQQMMQYQIEGYQPYERVFQQRIQYKSLENSIVFTSTVDG